MFALGSKFVLEVILAASRSFSSCGCVARTYFIIPNPNVEQLERLQLGLLRVPGQSPNAPTVPREEMYRITTMYPEDPRAPFYDPHGAGGAGMQPMARLYITREAVTRKPCKDDDDGSQELDKEAVFEDIEAVDDGEKRTWRERLCKSGNTGH